MGLSRLSTAGCCAGLHLYGVLLIGCKLRKHVAGAIPWHTSGKLVVLVYVIMGDNAVGLGWRRPGDKSTSRLDVREYRWVNRSRS